MPTNNGNGNGHVRPPIGWKAGMAQDFAGGHIRMSNDELNAWIEQTSANPETASHVLGLYLDTVKPEVVQWLWPSRIPAGKLSLLIGDPGLGKSTVTLDIAARISIGAPWPGGGLAPQGKTILLTAEDGLADTVRPRIDRQGGDASRIFAVTGVKIGEDEREFNLKADLERLEKQIEFFKPKLLVIDPLSAYLGDNDSHKDSEIRGLLRPLTALAERHNVAVLCVLHMNKSAQNKALYRALGSIAFVASARSVFGIGLDPNDKERRLMMPIKSNLAKMPAGLAYRFDETGKLLWDETPVEINVDSVLGFTLEPDEEKERTDAEDFLETILGSGTPVSAVDVFRDARENRIPEKTLKRAKQRLGIESERVQDRWFWLWPKKKILTQSLENEGKGAKQEGHLDKMAPLPKILEQSQLDHDFTQEGQNGQVAPLVGPLAPESESGTLNAAGAHNEIFMDHKSDDAIASRDDESSKAEVCYRVPTTRKKKK